MGDYLGARLEKLKTRFSFIKQVKGIALMRALELSVEGAPIVAKAREKGLLINDTQGTILRIMPAITISKKVLDRGLAILEETLQEVGCEVAA